MITIKIISGTYGYSRDGFIHPVSRGGTCDVLPAEAERLAALGVAEIIGNSGPEPVETPPVTANEDAQTSDMDAVEFGVEAPQEGYHLDAAQLESMTVANLKSLAEDMGIKPAARWTKADYVAAIAAVEVEPGEFLTEDDLEEPPALSAEAPIV